MKKFLSLFIFLSVLPDFFFAANAKSGSQPRIGIAGISIECSTFSPAQTSEDMFRVKKGNEVFDLYPFFRKDSLLRSKAEWVPTMVSRATPGGIVTREAYESLVGQTLELLKKNMPYDALFLDIHGAMSVVGLDDPEGDFIIRVREVIGNKPVISTCMDPHGCVTKRLAKNTDLITCYRMAPHEDRYISQRRAVTNLLDRVESGKGKPKYKAWVYVPVLLPGEKTSTRIDPGKTLYAQIVPQTAKKGVIDASIWISYAWADEPRNHGVVMVVGDNKQEVKESAEALAKHFWDVRDKFEFVAPTASLDECLAAAFKGPKRPYFLSDMGDNPTAGGAGDVSWTLQQLLNRKELQSPDGPNFVYASIPGKELTEAAIKAGIDNQVSGYAGAKIDNRYAGPVKIEGTVEAIKESENNKEVVIRSGSLHIIVTESRKPYHYEKDFTDLGIDPKKTDIIMVKLGYLTEQLFDLQADWMMALTKGGVDQDLLNLPYKRINRPMYPLDPDMKAPSLKAEFIELSE